MKNTFGQEKPDEIRLPASSASVPALLEFVSNQAEEVGLGKERVRDITRAIEEALSNIIHCASQGGEGEIEIRCGTHGEDVFLIDIVDSCRPFNMLAATTFPEAGDFTATEGRLSTSKLKKIIKNIEYRRDPKNNTNILCCMVAK